ncbi:hypothetical protein [Magnetococcus sp. PR-3]|uniref:hypothetical protein n=1 Tax=Magnetococcus sp. PR-3 TaxID=3120355 RepID=UPI002FCE4E31
MDNFVEVFNLVSGVVTVAGSVAAMTPNPNDDGWVAKANGVVNLLALNFWGARNAKS